MGIEPKGVHSLGPRGTKSLHDGSKPESVLKDMYQHKMV